MTSFIRYSIPAMHGNRKETLPQIGNDYRAKVPVKGLDRNPNWICVFSGRPVHSFHLISQMRNQGPASQSTYVIGNY